MIRKTVVVAFACLMMVSMFAPFAAGAPATTQAATPTEPITQSQSPTERIDPAPIEPSLQDADTVEEVVVRLSSADVSPSASRAEAVSTMKQHAQETQMSVLEYARDTQGVHVEQRLWLTNAVLLEVDTSQVDLESIALLPNVQEIHSNFELAIPEPVESSGTAPDDTSADSYDTTYGLDQVNATEVWETHGTMGEGAKVAVLDTGVDESHPDIDLYTEDPSDPTYPGGWAEFDGDGNIVPGSEPHDTDTHGTHTSGTVAGGNASGEWIGVAPEVDLMHGLVIPGGSGSFVQVAAGMEWAVNESADVISMSLGCGSPIFGSCYDGTMLEAVQNAEAAGTIVVGSAGNCNEGCSGSPGNVYEAIAIGASNENANIASFSSGEEVDTSADWGSSAPSDWPETYVVPDVAAPGVDVKSAQPGGGYAEFSGTSMSAPHTAGVLALMISAGGNPDMGTLKSTLYETAWKPAGEPSGNDTRYGAGIIDAKAATDPLALENGINGTVTSDAGGPIQGATVETATGFSATTDGSGYYEMLAEQGNRTVTVDAFGYDSETTTVFVPNGSTATVDFSLAPALDVTLTSGQTDSIATGENVTVTADVAHLETLTVEKGGSYSGSADLWINGDAATFGEAYSFGGQYSGEVAVTVATAEGANGELSLTHTFAGANDTQTVETGPTEVFDEYVQVGVVDDDDDYGDDIESVLSNELSAQFELSVLTSAEAINSTMEYDAFVVQQIDEDNAEAFAAATSSPRTGVVWLDQWGSDSNGIEARSDAIGDPVSTDDEDFQGTPYYEVTKNSTLFDGVASVGDTVDIHSGSFGDYAWFDDTEGTVVADVGTPDGGIAGSGMAVDRDRNSVLAATLGWSTFVEGDFTADAKAVLANSVETVTIFGPQPAGVLDVSEVRAQPGSVGTVDVTSTVPDVAGYQVTLHYDPSVISVEEVNGLDFADPVVNVDDQNGTVTFAQAQAQGVDSPDLAELEIEMVGDRGDETNISIDRSSALNYANGTAAFISYDMGHAEVASCTAGDVNEDGSVTAADAIMVQRHIAGLPVSGPFNEACADMNADGAITSADVTEILKIVVGISTSDGQASVSSSPVGLAGA